LTAVCGFLNKFEKVTLQPDEGTSAPVRNWWCGTGWKKVRNYQNNFRTSAPTENYFHSNGNNVSF